MPVLAIKLTPSLPALPSKPETWTGFDHVGVIVPVAVPKTKATDS